MKGYNIEVKNNLLEPKHIQNMGAAVWLYMWLLDKMTSVNENGVGKVLGSTPVTFERVAGDLGIDRRTYTRWVKKLRENGYIQTIRSKHGQVITVNKATKSFNRKSDKSGTSTRQDSTIVAHQDRTKVAHHQLIEMSHSDASLYIDDIVQNDNSSKDLGELKPAEYKEQVSKLYYQVIYELDIPVRNHNNVRSAIAKLCTNKDRKMVVNYLNFMIKHYPVLEWDFKPDITEAMDIHDKRAKVRTTFSRHVNQNSPNTKGRGIKL